MTDDRFKITVYDKDQVHSYQLHDLVNDIGDS